MAASAITGEQALQNEGAKPPRAGDAIAIRVARTFNPLTLIETRDGKRRSSSLSKFQMLLWTFVIGGLFIYTFLVRRELLDLPDNFVWLMGLSMPRRSAPRSSMTALRRRAIRRWTESRTSRT